MANKLRLLALDLLLSLRLGRGLFAFAHLLLPRARSCLSPDPGQSLAPAQLQAREGEHIRFEPTGARAPAMIVEPQMMQEPVRKYRPFPPVQLTDRQWPSKV